ncbi:MAG: Uma2 family endonuclease [Candidatus Eremiobacteraeota bacterium]|nr:Uma2 family endonuclease [Candidatus Eremiobacteraeota bacterium]MBC5821446.1 Uma2 family endonuclease [Candidatus Eremiobacteraeota bacterium]
MDPAPMTMREFLRFVDEHEGRFELVNGHPLAFAHPTKRHNRIVNALHARIYAHVTPHGCDSYASDILVAAGLNGRSPDIVVTCDERDQVDAAGDEDARIVRYPKLIIEVLSETTAETDLGDKLAEYQQLASLEEYALLDSRRRWGRLYRRDPAGHFVFDADLVSGTLTLASIDLQVDLAQVYDAARVG